MENVENNNMEQLIDSFTIYLEVNKNYSPGTVQAYNGSLIKLYIWLKDTRNITLIQDINTNDLQLFLGTLRHPQKINNSSKNHPKAGKIFEATTRARNISAIKQFFKWAIKQRYIQYDVSQYIENPKMPSRLPKSLTLQDAVKFEESSTNRKFKERDHLITVLFLLLGIRVSELVNIDLHHINYDEGTISIIGKGNKERRLAITPKIINGLTVYLPLRKEVLIKRNNIKETALFISLKRGQRLNRRSIALIIEDIAAEADVKANNLKVSPHKLRHTCATVLYNDGQGADLLALADLLGHADPKTTTIYTKVNTEKMRNIITSNPLELT
ncbi:tyrosine-type recombinase/integrase [Paenibacillus sp. Leaf72]|uniref:tyrosine-type recombinase/integrase n=1 Tax=Paenibacillus sp. Leaf72 TaxID=1736234 RepID=UPI000700ABFA|nr:tyrosine-type recombinase/integrase [Paenibacillus sp. Leaf72]KQN96786.1 hypothetical protein ASF12_22195 [Paenibacillus sp. Leaf72]